MSNTVHIDKRITKTKNNLKSALVKLLETNKIEDISIVKLTSYAGVNRKTFYLHYSDVLSVFKEIENSAYEKAKKVIVNFELSVENLENFLFELFSVFTNNEHVLALIKNTPFASNFTKMLDRLLIDEVNKKYSNVDANISTPLQYTIAYHVFGSVRLFYTWVRNNQSLDLVTFSKFLATIVIKGAIANFE